MKVTGKEGGPVDRAKAKRWTANYRKAGKGRVRSHLFGVDRIQELLNQEGCMGVKAYYALDDEGEQQLLLVGVDADDNTMEEGLILDMSKTCPPECSSGDLDN